MLTDAMPEPRPSNLPAVRYVFEDPLVPARLIRRYKRFLADVELDDGRIETVHCPNSGSMLTCLEEDAPVYLSPAKNPNRKTKYTWEMIFIDHGWVGINTLIPNLLVTRAAELEALAVFEGATSVRREVRINAHTRIDLLVQLPGEAMYVEVKNVTLVKDGRASFPDAVTTRGQKHVAELTELVKAGGSAGLVYVVQRSDAEVFGPAGDIDPEYARLFGRAQKEGLAITAIEAEVGPSEIRFRRELPVEF